jgi:hypothetical protein
MKRIPEQEIRKALSDFSPEDVEALVMLVKSICQKREAEGGPFTADLSDAEDARILSVLDSVAALSQEKSPAGEQSRSRRLSLRSLSMSRARN